MGITWKERYDGFKANINLLIAKVGKEHLITIIDSLMAEADPNKNYEEIKNLKTIKNNLQTEEEFERLQFVTHLNNFARNHQIEDIHNVSKTYKR